MSTIIAYTGNANALPKMREIIGSQIYKGAAEYGMYILSNHKIEFFSGRVNSTDDLVDLSNVLNLEGRQSLCYLKWGEHPDLRHMNSGIDHTSENGVALIFQGRVSNLQELKEFLSFRGYQLSSASEAEIISVLINENFKSGDYSLRDSISTALSLVEGEYALVAMAADDPESLVAAMSNRALAVGHSEQSYLVSNQSRVLLDQTKNVTYLNTDEIAYMNLNKEISIESFKMENTVKHKSKGFAYGELNTETEMMEPTGRARDFSKESIRKGMSGFLRWSGAKPDTNWIPGNMTGLTLRMIAFQLMLIYLVSASADFAGKVVYYDQSEPEQLVSL